MFWLKSWLQNADLFYSISKIYSGFPGKIKPGFIRPE